MKKKNLKSLKLNKKIVSNLSQSKTDKIKGGSWYCNFVSRYYVEVCTSDTTSFDFVCNPDTDYTGGASCDCTGEQ